MEEELAMLRQLIGQLQELLNLYGSPPPNSSFYILHHSRPEEEDHSRWCFPSIEEGSADECCDLVMAAGDSPSCKMLEPVTPPPSKKPRKEKDRGKSSSDSKATEAMDQQVWRDLPEDLFEAIIARLPISTFFQFRLVCRKWNSLLNSQSFSQRCAEIPQTVPWFYTINHENVSSGAMYDPSLKKWHQPVTSSLPEKAFILPVASAGGLVCFVEVGHRNFYVTNPLTKSFRELPTRSVEVWSRIAVGMTLNGTSACEGYKVVWVGCDGEFEIYDSTKNVWIRPGTMPVNIKLPISLNFRSQAVSIGPKIYFMVSDPEGILCYDTETWLWKQDVIPAPPHVKDPMLAECGGRIMLVGLLTKNAATCVCVWELQRMTLLWKEVDRMPNIWCLEFYGKHVRMGCLGNKGLLLLLLRSVDTIRLMTYDVVTREWLEVPASMVPRGWRRQLVACGTAFHPCLTAKA